MGTVLIPGIKKPHTLQFSACGRSFPHSALKSREIEGVKARNELLDRALDLVRTARGIRLDVERHVRIVERHPEQRPAARKDDAHALVGGLCNREPLFMTAFILSVLR